MKSRDYTLEIDPDSPMDFGSIFAGDALPIARTVTLTNSGNQNLTLQAPSSSGTAYALGDLSATSLAPQETASFTVQPKGNLAPGSYNETVTVSTVQGSSAAVAVTFTVQARDYSITAVPTALGFGSIFEGAALPDAQTITLTNVGNQNLTLQAPSSSGTAYAISALSATNLAPQETASFTVQPKGNLAPGSYNETVTVSTKQGSSAAVAVTFTVQACDYTISAAPANLGFGSIFEGEALPDAQTITLTNSGNQNLTLQAPSSSGTAYAISALSATSLAPQETASFTVQPKGNLGPGSYNETVTVSTVQGSSAAVTVTFTVWSVYQKRTLIDFDAGVSVTGESVHKDAKLIVEELTLHPPGQCAACDTIRQAQADSASLLVLGLNISLDQAPGFIGELLVTLAVDPQYNGKTITILHCRKGVLETYSAVVSEGEVTFTVTALSPMALFAAVEKATAPEPQKTLPITGFGGPALLLLPGAAVALMGAALLYRRRRLSRK